MAAPRLHRVVVSSIDSVEPLATNGSEEPSVPGAHDPDDAKQHVHTNFWLRWMPLATALTISAFSLNEIWETVRAPSSASRKRIGHAHGMLGLGVVKLIVWLEEESWFALAACAFALLACASEVIRDLKPGGHHGAALLAASELIDHYYRLRPSTRAGRQSRRLVTLAISVPAALFAVTEMVEDALYKPGAHHAVALLAAAQFVENSYRVLASSLGMSHSPDSNAIVV